VSAASGDPKKVVALASQPARGRRVKEAPAPAPAAAPMRSPTNTLNLIGQRVEPALDRLDTFIDGLLRQNESYGFVIHGHGTGALKGAVRDHLRGHRAVTRAEPAAADDGGDALTLLWLG
jgi:DNA mismatch repair protein MutS2